MNPTMKEALKNAGLVPDDIKKRGNEPKITIKVSRAKKDKAGEKKPKKEKNELKKIKNKSKKNLQKKSKVLPKQRAVKSLTKIPDERTALDNIYKLGFSGPKDALSYWDKIKQVVRKKTDNKALEDLNFLNIKTPKGIAWRIGDFKTYKGSMTRIFKHIEEHKSLKGLESLKLVSPDESKKDTVQEHKKTTQISEKRNHGRALDHLDTDTLFERYREAILSDSKGNSNLSRVARKTIDEINREFLTRFGGKIKGDYFVWPSTEVYASHLRLKNKVEWQRNGILGLYGYCVGKTHGEPPNVRRKILDEVFKANIPPVLDFAYIREWSIPKSAPRLEKMANTLASLARNEKRKGALYAVAYGEREEDLSYLYKKYYLGKFGFGWPDT